MAILLCGGAKMYIYVYTYAHTYIRKLRVRKSVREVQGGRSGMQDIIRQI